MGYWKEIKENELENATSCASKSQLSRLHFNQCERRETLWPLRGSQGLGSTSSLRITAQQPKKWDTTATLGQLEAPAPGNEHGKGEKAARKSENKVLRALGAPLPCPPEK